MTPKSVLAYAYEAYLYQSPDNGWPDFEQTLTEQGYVVIRYKDGVFDDNPESATLTNFVNMGHSGVLGSLYNHGNTIDIAVEVYKTEAARNTAYNAYVAAGWSDGVEIMRSNWESPPYYFYTIDLRDTGFTNRIKPETDIWLTIVYLGGSCNSWGLVDNVGGRVRFACDGKPSNWAGNLKELLDWMSGIKGNGNHRPAGEAYSNGTYESVFKMDGDGKTTLCPVVLSHEPTGAVGPGTVTGKVSFDTESWDLRPATDIIEVSANATLNSASWSRPRTEITFEIGGLNVGETITVIVDEDDLLSYNNVTHLDGNQTAVNTDGTRPNQDDFIWTFTSAVDDTTTVFDLPALSEAGLVVMILVLLVAATALLRRRQRTTQRLAGI